MKIKTNWTVLLLRPDYVASEFGHDTLLEHVMATTPPEALQSAQENACIRDDTKSPEDYYCLLCTHGHLQDLSDGHGGVSK
jgi:hypothetical protein